MVQCILVYQKFKKCSRCLLLLLTERNSVNQSGHNKCEILDKIKGYGYSVIRRFQQYFSYISAILVSFIGGLNDEIVH